jgi:chromosome segregation ATPase
MGVNSDVDNLSPLEVSEEQNGNQFTFVDLSEGKDGDVDDDYLQRFGQTNPMMQRVQEALRSQLQRTQDRVKNELLQQEEVLRKLRLEREEVGLKLFTLQQQLEQVDSNFHKANEMYHSLLTSREEHDALIHQHKLTLENCTKEARELVALNALAQTELHRSNLAAAQAKDLNETLKGDISVAKRVAQKTEQDIKELEKGKNAQDLHILHLKERIHPLEDDIDLTTQQLQSQKSQTATLKKMIKETTAEFDALGVDTKQILQQWKTSVVALQLRDEGLMAAKAALKAIQDEIKEIATELNYSQREVVAQTQRNAALVTASTRQENEANYLEGLNTAIQTEQDVMAQKYEEINKSIFATNFEENRLSMDLRKVRTEIATLEQKIKLVESESTRLEQMYVTLITRLILHSNSIIDTAYGYIPILFTLSGLISTFVSKPLS